MNIISFLLISDIFCFINTVSELTGAGNKAIFSNITKNANRNDYLVTSWNS